MNVHLVKCEFEISREFNAPRELVFKVFTEPEHLVRWWGPSGWKTKVNKLDFQPGGVFHYSMSMNGQEIWGRFVYREITPPERIVFINSFSNADGGIARHPMMPGWPAEVLNVMTLTEKNRRTTVTMQGGPINATEEERRIFESGFPFMLEDFKGTCDQLEAYLTAIQN